MNTKHEYLREFDVVRESRFGFLALSAVGDAVSELVVRDYPPSTKTASSPRAEAMAAAVCAYLDTGVAERLPTVCLSGTAFQRRVWAMLRRISRGRVRTYGDVASALGSSARAVGGACRANPVMILVPCHRVVAANGLGGFAGSSTGELPALKARLLAAEGVCIR